MGRAIRQVIRGVFPAGVLAAGIGCATQGVPPLALAGERVDAPAPAPEALDVDRERRREERLAEMRDVLGDRADRFRFAADDPFLIGTDLPEERLAYWQGVIRSYAEAFWVHFFPDRPDDWRCIYLFADPDAYAAVTGSRGMGFHSSERASLFVNIRSGGGTLIHELVHMLHHADRGVEGCPLWFREGLGSLFEKCGIDEDGRPYGETNWRLELLQASLGGPMYLPWERMMRMDDRTFMQNAAMGYAEARYIMFYLQEIGKLREFYAHYRTAEDRTGIASLGVVLDRPLAEAEVEWIEWVRNLNVDRGNVPQRGPTLGIRVEGEDKLTIARVTENTPAERAGMKPGDRILRFGEADIESFEQLVGLIRASEEGQEVTVVVRRGEGEDAEEIPLTVRF